MEKLKPILKVLFALFMGATVIWSFMAPDAESFQRPELARIFFYHFPCALVTTAFLLLAPLFSLRFLFRQQRVWDVRAEAANELGFLFASLVMATGIIFSKAQWGAWWQWDPRQTSFLMVLLLYAGYFALRSAFVDEAKRAANAAAYSVATALPALFLVFVFPRLPQVAQASFHPTQTIAQGQLIGDYRSVTVLTIIGFFLLAAWVYRKRVQVGLLELELENLDDRLETDRGDSAASRVVRPVPVSRES